MVKKGSVTLYVCTVVKSGRTGLAGLDHFSKEVQNIFQVTKNKGMVKNRVGI